jgi:hypothetical protein
MNDPEYFEKWRYKDTINVYNSIIEEVEKLYKQYCGARVEHQSVLKLTLVGDAARLLCLAS